MCKVGRKLKHKSAVGYKAVIKKNGKFYSPCTGLEYKEGMTMPNLARKDKGIHADRNWSDVLDPMCSFHTNDMQGKTGVFEDINSIDNAIGCSYNYIKLKMTLGGEIYDGKYCGYNIRLGTKIISMQEMELYG